jgi:hypothetical protein
VARPRDTEIENVEAYAVTVAGHRIADYLRTRRPRHYSVRNSLRYFVRHLPGYAEWQTPAGLVTGLVEQIGVHEAADAIDVAYLVGKPAALPFYRPAGHDIDRMDRVDWDRLLDRIYEHLHKPVLLNDLAAIACAVLQVREARAEAVMPDPPDPRQSMPDLDSRDILRQVWAEIVQLLPRQRIALLLNMGDDGDPGLFLETGIVDQAGMGAALHLAGEQYGLLWQELPLSPAERAELGGGCPGCTVLLRHVPIADLLIARLLDATREQVIGLRRKARERLARRVRDCAGRGGNKTSGSAPSGDSADGRST